MQANHTYLVPLDRMDLKAPPQVLMWWGARRVGCLVSPTRAGLTLALPSDKAPKLDWRSHHSMCLNILRKEHRPCRSLAEWEPASSHRVAIQTCW